MGSHRVGNDWSDLAWLSITINWAAWAQSTRSSFILLCRLIPQSVGLFMSNSWQPHGLSTPGFPVLHYFLEFAQTHIHYCHPTISSSVALFSSCSQSFPASRSLPMRYLCASGVHSIIASASASVLPMNIQDWFPLGLTGMTSLLSKELSRVFSSTTIQKHGFFGTQPSWWSNSHIYTWLLEKP